MLKKIIMIVVMALTVFSVGQAFAQPASELEKKELVLLIKTMNNAAERKDASLIVNNMPDRVYQEMAERMNISEQDLRRSLQKAVEEQFAQIVAGGYRLESSGIHYQEAKNGTFYALVPTRIETKNAVIEFMTPALYDNTKWHLIYGGQKTIQNPIFTEIYPYTAEITLPVAKISAKTAK